MYKLCKFETVAYVHFIQQMTMVGKISKHLDNLINKLKKYTLSITVNILLNLVAKPAAF